MTEMRLLSLSGEHTRMNQAWAILPKNCKKLWLFGVHVRFILRGG